MDSKPPQTEDPLSLRERARVRGSKTKLLQYAKRMRQDASDAEQLLWKYIRDRQLDGHKFRRQVVIEPFIVDFACLDARLIVEIDGGQHMEQEPYDSRRSRILESKGYTVLRFWNHEVLKNYEGVLSVIAGKLSVSPHPNPLPEGEGGKSC